MGEGDEAAVETEVLGRLQGWRAGLGEELGRAFDALTSRLRLFEGARGDGYFSHPTALPVVQMPRWIAASAEEMARSVAWGEAAAAGYLHVRVEDDLLDEGVGEPATALMLSGALFARHQTILVREIGGERGFWALFEEVWTGYAEAMLLERRLQRGEAAYDAGAFARVLARSRPLVLPAAAALFAGGRGDDLARLEELVGGLAASHQLFTDLLHAEKDCALGNTTHVLWRLGVRAGRDTVSTLRAELFARGGFDALLDEARQELARAEAAAAALGLSAASRFLKARAQYMTEVQQRIFQAFFAALQGGTAEGEPENERAPR